MTFAIAYLYTAELFPTSVRNVAVGAASTFARVGSMSAPYIVDLLVRDTQAVRTIWHAELIRRGRVVNAKLKSNRTGRRQPGLPSDDLRHFLRHRRPLLAHAARDAQQEDAGVGGRDREIRQDAQ